MLPVFGWEVRGGRFPMRQRRCPNVCVHPCHNTVTWMPTNTYTHNCNSKRLKTFINSIYNSAETWNHNINTCKWRDIACIVSNRVSLLSIWNDNPPPTNFCRTDANGRLCARVVFCVVFAIPGWFCFVCDVLCVGRFMSMAQCLYVVLVLNPICAHLFVCVRESVRAWVWGRLCSVRSHITHEGALSLCVHESVHSVMPGSVHTFKPKHTDTYAFVWLHSMSVYNFICKYAHATSRTQRLHSHAHTSNSCCTHNCAYFIAFRQDRSYIADVYVAIEVGKHISVYIPLNVANIELVSLHCDEWFVILQMLLLFYNEARPTFCTFST